ncbi:MAG TPA: M17 family peptidase N-terminal domain-containing protein, partial [Candidatus Nanoarchaeia archaeon]|nr:M17 family peptidase N-terminal domain-containing protein [Candidatus Nanoarchaeia archaeon]
MKIDIGFKKGVLVVPVHGEKDKISFFDAKKNKDLKEKIKHEVKSYPAFSGKKEEAVFMKLDSQKVLLIGVNKDYSLEDLRRSYSVVFKTLKARKETTATLEVPEEGNDEIKAVVEGLDLSDYKFDKYIMKKEEKDVVIEVSLDVDKKFASVVKESMMINAHVKETRDLVNENASVKYPQYLANLVEDFAKKHHLKTTVLDEKDMKKEGLGLILAVGRGAVHQPRLIIAEYHGDPKS